MKKVLVGTIITLNSIAYATGPLDNLPGSVIKLHQALGETECESDLESTSESYLLDSKQKTALYIVPCTRAAYNTTERAYISYNNGEFAEPVIVLGHDGKGIVGTMVLGSAGYDPKSKTLYTFFKGRGLGDCGDSSKTKISVTETGGVFVRTVEIRGKTKCDGHPERGWPVIFKQK